MTSESLSVPVDGVRTPRSIALWNAATFGVGYVLLGQWQKALVAVVLALVIGPITLGVGAVFLAIFTAIDGYHEAIATQRGAWTFFGRGRRNESVQSSGAVDGL
jgi:hypothetical protein